MDAINAIANCNGRNQCLHREAPKRSQDEPLKHNKEGRGNQPQSHKAVLPTNATRALWGWCEYQNNTHTTTTIIAARASIVAKHAQRMQTATFCQPAQESRVIRLTWWRQLSSPSAWLTWTKTTTSASNKKKTKLLWHARHASHARQLLDKQQIELSGRAGDTIFSDKRTNTSNDNKKYHFVGTPKVKRMLAVWCSGPATATSSRVQSAKKILG